MKNLTHLMLPTENLEHLLDESLVKEIMTQNPENATAALNSVLKLIFKMGQQNAEELFGVIPESTHEDRTVLMQLCRAMNIDLSTLQKEIVREGLAKLVADHSLSQGKPSDSSLKK